MNIPCVSQGNRWCAAIISEAETIPLTTVINAAQLPHSLLSLLFTMVPVNKYVLNVLPVKHEDALYGGRFLIQSLSLHGLILNREMQYLKMTQMNSVYLA